MKNFFNMLAFALLLNGCGSMYYQPTSGAPTASLTIVNQSTVGDVGPGIFEKPDCSDGGRAMAYNTVPFKGSKTYTLEAGKPAPIIFSGFRSIKAPDRITAVTSNVCESFISFVPLASHHYEAIFNDNGEACAISLIDVTANGHRPVETARRRWLNANSSPTAGGRVTARCPTNSN